MKIGIIQASSQKSKNRILDRCVRDAAGAEHEVINFGIYEDDKREFSYIQAAVCVGLLLESKSVDFVVTGCSSGQGMMLACNTLPGVLCGYVANVSDAYLFGRINNGNAVSYPLGLNWGWGAEINLTETLRALFSTPMGMGYPKEEAWRKIRDAGLLKEMNRFGKVDFGDFVRNLREREEKLSRDAIWYPPVFEYVMEHGVDRIKEVIICEGQKNEFT
ncbi:MAG: RpiB/LacA/LacB family sugar-phosphate isomerase [Lachnospiraceae bacterium]|nr:RpiB/LacA/LacB family sugar-phosphate isomerase [Lachnospiraceae bacterium]